MSDAANEIRKLQQFRAKPERNITIDSVIDSIQNQASQTHRKLGSLIELWSELVPPGIQNGTTLLGLRGGVLTVAADSSAVAFELDRLLRDGLLADVRSRFRGTLTRIKVKISAAEQP